MNRLPIRLRLTLAFTLVMASVLAATGLFVYYRQSGMLDSTLHQALRTRAADVAALARQSDNGLRQGRKAWPDGGLAQVIGSKGNVIDATPGIPQPLLTPAQLIRASTRVAFFRATTEGERLLLRAQPVRAQGQKLVVVVGSSLEQQTESLLNLRRQLLVGGPIALVLASLAGYSLAAAALRPVERMGERAATISAASPGRRLPVPAADDEIARLGRRLNEMLTRLERTLDRERTLISNASHELRTPLSLMKTEIELALAEPDSAPVLAAALRSAAEEIDRLSQLTDDLLLLARADSGELPLRRNDVPAAELLATIATRYERRAAEAGRTIHVTAPPGLVVRGDRRRLEQALANLVENALRHGAGSVGLQAAAENGTLELSVTDHGPGFPLEFLGRAFDRFSRAEAARDTPGTGLGLTIVAAIAQAHGGNATACNQPGGGACVTLELPRTQSGAPGPAMGD